MTDLSARMKPAAMEMHEHSPGIVLRSLVIGLTAFLTVVDLFATQAILPSLTRRYGVTPAACYFFGGLVGTAVLGRLFDSLGWTACVIGVGVCLAFGAALTLAPKPHAP
nr:hypothetical protein [Bradyrhizobium japonicum]